jgi:hypothetical protein
MINSRNFVPSLHFYIFVAGKEGNPVVGTKQRLFFGRRWMVTEVGGRGRQRQREVGGGGRRREVGYNFLFLGGRRREVGDGG